MKYHVLAGLGCIEFLLFIIYSSIFDVSVVAQKAATLSLDFGSRKCRRAAVIVTITRATEIYLYVLYDP